MSLKKFFPLSWKFSDGIVNVIIGIVVDVYVVAGIIITILVALGAIKD